MTITNIGNKSYIVKFDSIEAGSYIEVTHTGEIEVTNHYKNEDESRKIQLQNAISGIDVRLNKYSK